MSETRLDGPITGKQHWTRKGDVRLFLWQKNAGAPSRQTRHHPVRARLVDGLAADLRSQGAGPAGRLGDGLVRARGFDTWCMDNEGYGRSDKSRPINCDIANGADDLAAGTDYILKTADSGPLLVYGISSGALQGRAVRRAPSGAGRAARARRLRVDRRRQPDAGRAQEEARRVPARSTAGRSTAPSCTRSSAATIPAPRTTPSIEAFADAILALDDSRADRHLRRHVLEAAARRSGQDHGADDHHARRSGTASPASRTSPSSSRCCPIPTSSSRSCPASRTPGSSRRTT